MQLKLSEAIKRLRCAQEKCHKNFHGEWIAVVLAEDIELVLERLLDEEHAA